MTEKQEHLISEIKEKMDSADRILVGLGAGMSAAAGLNYLDSEVFAKYYPDMAKFGYEYQYQLVGMGEDEWTQGRKWAYLATHVNYVRNIFPPAPLYQKLLGVLTGYDYFIVTSNADRQLMRGGFPMERVFEYQGNYDVFSCSKHCTEHTWDNYEDIQRIIAHIDRETFECPEEYIPRCPYCGAPAVQGFRPENWQSNADRYVDYINGSIGKKFLLIEIGVGFNTPGVIRWPFEKITYQYDDTFLIRVNRGYVQNVGHAGYPRIPVELLGKSLSVNMDAKDVIETLYELKGAK